MADISDKLDQIAEQFAGKVDLATSELVSYLRELVKGKTAAQSLEILSTVLGGDTIPKVPSCPKALPLS